MGHLSFKIVLTTGIIGAIAGDCSMCSYDFHLVNWWNKSRPHLKS